MPEIIFSSNMLKIKEKYYFMNLKKENGLVRKR